MTPKNQIKRATPSLSLVALVVAYFGLLPQMQAALPSPIPGNPDGCYPAFTTAEGCDALKFLGAGTANTGLGWRALFFAGDSSFNTGVGAGALALTTTGGNANTAVGAAALLLNTTGFGNTAVGAAALLNNTTGGTLATTEGLDVGPNTAVGANALGANTIASANTAVGYQALGSMVAGFDFGTGTPTDVGISTAVGFQALANVNSLSNAANDAFGYQALFNLTDGAANVAIGTLAGFSLTSGNGNIYIGNPGAGPESNTIRIGGLTVFPGPRRTFIRGIREVTTENNDAIPVVIDSDGQLGTMSSSRRFKHEIKAMDNASEAIHALKPVTFHYKSDATSTPQFGLIAEEVANVNPDLVVRDADGGIYTVRYDAVNAMLLNEFLKEHAKVEQLKKDFESKIAEQQKQIETLSSGLQKVSAQLELNKATPQTVAENQ
jgi:trimeric autotransporter adhesin